MKNKNWTFVYSEGHSLLLNEVFFLAFTDYPEIPGIFKTIIYVNKGGFQICYVPQKELDRVREQGKIFFDAKYRTKFQREIAQCAKNFSIFWEKYKKINMFSLSNAELLNIFNDYVKNLTLMCAYYQVSGGRSFPVVEEYVKKRMARYFNKKDLDNNYSLVLTSTELDILNREEIDLFRLARERNINEKKLRSHAKNYAFNYLSTYDEKKIFSSLRKRIRELRETYRTPENYLSRFNKEKRQKAGKQRKVMNKLKGELKLVNIIEFLRFQGKIRFDYKEWFMGAEYKFLDIFKEISRRIGISLEEYLHSYRIKDTRAFLQKGMRVLKPQRIKRLNIFVLIQDKEKKYFYSGKKAQNIEKEILKFGKERISELKGVSANPGKVTGKARIILPKSFEHIQKVLEGFQKGEVLITTMTQPSLVAVMKKAVAIVTNQGGITSHAAVLSREFDIPCIVGTNTATEVFNNGDLVEVDANKGVIRKIK